MHTAVFVSVDKIVLRDCERQGVVWWWGGEWRGKTVRWRERERWTARLKMERNGGRQRDVWEALPTGSLKIIAGPISQEALNPSIISWLVGCQTPARPRPDRWRSSRLSLRTQHTKTKPPTVRPHPHARVWRNLLAGYIIHAPIPVPSGSGWLMWGTVTGGCQCLDLSVCA